MNTRSRASDRIRGPRRGAMSSSQRRARLEYDHKEVDREDRSDALQERPEGDEREVRKNGRDKAVCAWATCDLEGIAEVMMAGA